MRTATASISRHFAVGYIRRLQERLILYWESKAVYSYPADKIESASKRKTSTVGRIHRRTKTDYDQNYSFGMNCGICRTTKISGFVELSATILFMEWNLGPKNYSG
ncbi:MAG: hypothetical protein M2R45_05086 [Verrucomicrobia subdivision 3 bacterium]|nr:hypothetical protein [Limisphaerales bacterium]MCS1417163.1 hypothetical protein [Limisphaerales bacterium]